MTPAARRERERLIEEGRMATGNLLDHKPGPWWTELLLIVIAISFGAAVMLMR